MRKILALALALALVLVSCAAAFADGTDGTITIPNATKGVTYKAYKILDATIGEADAEGKRTISYYTENEEIKALLSAEGSPFTVAETADASGRYAVMSEAEVADISAWIESNLDSFVAISATSGVDADDKATENTVEFADLAYGYYYVTSGLGSTVSINSTKPNVTIMDKNPQEPEGPEKVITAEDGVIEASDEEFTDNVKTNDAAVGSKESFKTTFTATNWVTTGTGHAVEAKKVEKFVVEDQPTNMTIDPTTITIIVGETTIVSGGAAADSTNYPVSVSVAAGDAGKLSVEITWVDSNGNSIYSATDGEAGIEVILTYEATILAAAATENAGNTVAVTYDVKSGDESETVELGEDETETDTWKFKIEKVDGETGDKLKGAQFELTLDGTKVTFVANSDKTVYRVASDGEEGATTTIDMGENSIVEIQGLDKKAYVLKEIQAPNGYNLLNTPVDVAEGNLTKASEDIADSKKVEVENNKGTELPSTGGIGTTIFYVIGGLLVLGAAIVLVARRKAESK